MDGFAGISPGLRNVCKHRISEWRKYVSNCSMPDRNEVRERAAATTRQRRSFFCAVSKSATNQPGTIWWWWRQRQRQRQRQQQREHTAKRRRGAMQGNWTKRDGCDEGTGAFHPALCTLGKALGERVLSLEELGCGLEAEGEEKGKLWDMKEVSAAPSPGAFLSLRPFLNQAAGKVWASTTRGWNPLIWLLHRLPQESEWPCGGYDVTSNIGESFPRLRPRKSLGCPTFASSAGNSQPKMQGETSGRN